MLLLAWRTPSRPFMAYLAAMALSAGAQHMRWWDLGCEVVLVAFTVPWIWSMLPKDRRGRVEALSLGLVLAAALMAVVPAAWPRYDAAMYFVRLYSAAAFLGISLPCVFFDWRNWPAVPWWGAVLMAGSQRGWNYVTVAVACNVTWTAMLGAWIWMGRKRYGMATN